MRASQALLAAALCAGAVHAARGEEPAERVVLRWQSVPGAAGYDLQVALDAGFSSRELDLRVELAGYRMAASGVRRYWRVRAVDADGRAGPWSASKTIEPLQRAPARADGPRTEAAPAPALLHVPPLPPAAVEEAAPQAAVANAPAAVEPVAEAVRPLDLRDEGLEGIKLSGVLRHGRPGAMVGWRTNLLGVTAPSVAIEGTWPLPWLGAAYSAALRAGWWRERATVPDLGGLTAEFEATADVLPIAAMAFGSFTTRWARAYAGAGPGVDLVIVRVPKGGALEASPTIGAVAGAGRRLGPGEAFAELAGGLGGVDGPLGRLRTGGISLSVGYRLTR